MKIISFEEVYYCVVRKNFLLEDFEKEVSQHLGMRKNSFAYCYSLKIFRDFFRYAKDLRQEYQDYYAQEYDDFETYLYQKELLERDDIALFELNQDQTLLKLRPSFNSYNVESIIRYDEEGIKILNQVLEDINL